MGEEDVIDQFEIEHAGVVSQLTKQLLSIAWAEYLTKVFELLVSLLQSLYIPSMFAT
jgi:hypothetical protein